MQMGYEKVVDGDTVEECVRVRGGGSCPFPSLPLPHSPVTHIFQVLKQSPSTLCSSIIVAIHRHYRLD